QFEQLQEPRPGRVRYLTTSVRGAIDVQQGSIAPSREHGTPAIKSIPVPTTIEGGESYGQRSNGFRSAKYRTSDAGDNLRHELDARNRRTESESEQGCSRERAHDRSQGGQRHGSASAGHSRALHVPGRRNASQYVRLRPEDGSHARAAGIRSASGRVHQPASPGVWRSNQRAWAKHRAGGK